jgi:nucleoside-diphosphate-sugar epimerase
MKKILITGGLGNLGSWLSEYFYHQGCEVNILSKNQRKLESNLKYRLIQCDIANIEDCKKQLSEEHFDYIVHAASVNDNFVPGYPELALNVNAFGTRNLLEVFKDKKIKSFIYFSTFQVYGKYDGSITEETSLTSKNDYGTTHLFAEYYVKQFGYTHNLPHTIVRLTNSYGCPKDYNSSKWYLILNDLSKTAFEKEEIILKSNGQAPRDFIWMGDVCAIVEKLINNEASNSIYNLSGEKTFKMIDIANYVKEAYKSYFGKEIEVKVNLEDKTKYPEDLFVSSKKLKSFIGDYKAEPKFIEEAKSIFEFLSKVNK